MGARPASCRPRLEPLESRWVPATGGTPDQNFVQQLFQDVLHRQAAATEVSALSAQLDNGTLTGPQVAFGIIASPEGLQVQVNDMYIRFLRRSGDATALSMGASYLGANNGNNIPVNTGTSTSGLAGSNTTGLQSQLLASAEYFARSGGTTEGFVTAVYLDVLCRTPDAADLGYWTQRLNNQSLSPQQFALNVLESPEGRADQVTMYYNSYLRRNPEASGQGYWSTRLGQNLYLDRNFGAVVGNPNVSGNRDFELMGNFLGGPEYFQKAQTLLAPATIPSCNGFNMFGGTSPPGFVGGVPNAIVYQQTSLFPVSGQVAVWDSINDTNPNGYGSLATAYDNFTVTVPSAISSVTWSGGFHGPATAVPLDSFTITFYANNANPPGAPLASYTIPFANAHQVIVGMQPGKTSPSLGATYAANLATPFVALANTTYWISIVANYQFTGPSNPQFVEWGWQIGSNDPDGHLTQDFNFPGSPLNGRASDLTPGLAFSLSILPLSS
jgi:hypothetical protein